MNISTFPRVLRVFLDFSYTLFGEFKLEYIDNTLRTPRNNVLWYDIIWFLVHLIILSKWKVFLIYIYCWVSFTIFRNKYSVEKLHDLFVSLSIYCLLSSQRFLYRLNTNLDQNVFVLALQWALITTNYGQCKLHFV